MDGIFERPWLGARFGLFWAFLATRRFPEIMRREVAIDVVMKVSK